MITVFQITEIEQYLDGIKAVIFDLDDTLYSEKAYVRSGYRKIAQLLPQVDRAEEKLYAFFEERKPAIDEFLRTEGLYSEEQKSACLAVYRNQTPEISLYEGVTELLCRMREKGLYLGIITDGRPEGQQAKITALGLETLVDEIIVTDCLGGPAFRKPNPAAYELMRERLCSKFGTDLAYSQMCYVGDNTKKDFIVPEEKGMRSIWFFNPDGIYSAY